jgi:hypothetical protein
MDLCIPPAACNDEAAPPHSQPGDETTWLSGGFRCRFVTAEYPLAKEGARAHLGVKHDVATHLALICGVYSSSSQSRHHRVPNLQKIPKPLLAPVTIALPLTTSLSPRLAK